MMEGCDLSERMVALDSIYFRMIVRALMKDSKEKGRMTDANAGAIVRDILDQYVLDLRQLIDGEKDGAEQ